MSTVVVTGAHGFIGRYTARHFAQEGWTVIGVGHGAWPKEEQLAWGVSRWHDSDITLEALSGCCETPEAIVCCAGGSSVSFSLENPFLDYLRTVGTVARTLEYARTRAPRAAVTVLSSGAVYGDAGQAPIAESAPCRPVSPYGVHKLLAEELCRSYAHHYSLRLSIARLFSVYGAELRKQLLWDTCRKAKEGGNGFFGSGEEVRDWLHVRDAAALIYAATLAASPACEVLNGGSGTGVAVRDIVSRLFPVIGREDAPRFTHQARAGDPDRIVADIGRARALGWCPAVALNDGLIEYAAWFASLSG
jgi:UDP-glucose 4-epimerase